MKHGSLFTGVGGFDLGFERAGFETAWQCEIEKFPRRVLARRWPETERHEDVRELCGRDLEPVDVVSFGSPCQDLSVAGRREGLDGARSGLFFEAARVVAERRPAFAVWENVPGAFSSNAGRDFRAVLDALRQLGANDVAWRVFDSQYAGVPQQRRRVYLVADFGGERAGEVLFEAEECAGHPPPRGEPRPRVAGALTSRTRGPGGKLSGRGGEDDYNLVAKAISAVGGGPDYGADKGTLVARPVGSLSGGTGIRTTDIDQTYVAGGPGDGLSYALARRDSKGPASNQATLVAYGLAGEPDPAEDGDLAWNVQTNDGGAHKRKDRPRGDLYVRPTRTSLTLGSSDQTLIAFDERQVTSPGNRGNGLRERSPSLAGQDRAPIVARAMAIRRLTPRECERLQGFPDGWTCLCEAAGETFSCRCPDGPRYRALGNAVTVSVAEWIARRIAAVL